MIKLRKDKTRLRKQWKVKSNYACRFYLDVFLWEDRESFVSNTHDTNFNTDACWNGMPWIDDLKLGALKVRPKLGELHFIVDLWNIEIVSHEVGHAIFQRMRVLSPTYTSVCEQTAIPEKWLGVSTTEELICYELGKWVENIYGKLWLANPSKKWKRCK